MSRITAYQEKPSLFRRFPLFCSILCLLCPLTTVQSDLESVSSSVEFTPQSNHPPRQDSNEHVADTLQVESRNGDPPGEIQTNDVPSDTPHSQLEQNSAPSVSSDGSSGSILASDTKSQEDRRELDESDNSNLQKDDEIIHDIHASLEEGVPGNNYERKGREEEGSESREMNEQGSINQASIAEEKGEKQLNGQVPITEHSPKGELSDQNLDENNELQQEAGITSQAISEGMESTHSMEGSGSLHEESIKKREASELDGGDDRKIAESANQEASEEGPTVIDSSSQEESEGVASGGKKERETAGDSGELSDSQPQEGERREGDGEGERKESEPTTTEEEEESSDDEMMTFEEFKQKKREEALLSAGGGGLEDQPPPVGVANPKRKNNYASVDCGAKVIRHNPEAKNSQDILSENKDAYMINPCSASIWFIVELCELVSVRSLEIASFELFSSTPKSFKVYASERFEEDATVDWIDLGTFHAEDERRVRHFPLETHVYAKYIKVEMLSHYGDEHYCPLSLLRVLGASMMDIYEESQQVKEQPPTTPPSLVLTEGQDKDDPDDDDDADSQTINKTLLRRAREAVLSMLEHPFRFVNEFISHDDSEASKTDELRRMEDAGSHDEASATPPPSAGSARGTPTSECTAGDECGGDEGVKIINMRQTQEDLASATPLENEQSESSILNTGTIQTTEVFEGLDSGGVDRESGMLREERSTDFKGEYPDITLLQSTGEVESGDPAAVTSPKESSLDTASTNEDAINGDLLSRGISLGPTNITKGASMMDGGDASQWNTGGAISVKDKVPPVISEGEQQVNTINREEGGSEEANGRDGDYKIKDKDSLDLSRASDIDNQIDPNGVEEQRDKINHTSTLFGREGIESPTTEGNNNKEGHPHNKDSIVSAEDLEPPPIVRTESDQLTIISPTPSQITQHPEQDLTIQTTNMIEEETEATGTSAHVASAASPMPTNDLHQANTANGFDAVDIVNGAQQVTAGHKAKESGAQVAAKDLPHGATNEGTSHVRLVSENAAGVPAASDASYAAPPDAIDAGKGGSISGVQTTAAVESQDKAISRGTDSSSHQPPVQGRDIPTQTIPGSTKDIQTSEADVSGIVAAACTDADHSTTTQGDRQKTQSESAVSDDDDENLDISESGGAESSPTVTKPDVLGSHSLHASSSMDSATVSYDEEANQNSGLPSSSPAGSKHEESNMDHLESEGMIGMKSGGKGSQGDNQKSTLIEDSSPSLSHSGTGDSSSEIGGHHDKQRNGMNGMQGMTDNSDIESHTHIPTGSSHSLDAPDNNSGDVSSDNSRQPTSPVTDGLPKTTDGHSLNGTRAYADNYLNSSPATVDSSHNAPRNVSLTENSINASLSTQQSLTDTQPQANGSLANQNAGLGAEEPPVGHSSQTQHRDDSETSNGRSSNSASPTQNQHQQGGTMNQGQNSSIPPLSVVGGGGNGNGVGGGGAGGHGGGSGGQVSSGRDREKSVFLRLSNQIQELEMNMSLFSSYLDQISTSLKKNKNRTEETTKALDKKISSLNESLLTLSQALSELTSREVGILRELRNELQSEAEELCNLKDRVDVIPNDVISKQLWLLMVQSVVVMAVFLISCMWLCRVNRNLERKLNTIQTALSSQNRPVPSQLTSIGVATENSKRKMPSTKQDSEQLFPSERTKLNYCSQSTTHARSQSFTSVTDLRKQAENIGDLSRADLKSLTTNRSKSWQENGISSGQNCFERKTVTALSGGPLTSHSLTSLDSRRSTDEVFSMYEGRKKRKHKSKKATG